jgi:hypothetical protein
MPSLIGSKCKKRRRKNKKRGLFSCFRSNADFTIRLELEVRFLYGSTRSFNGDQKKLSSPIATLMKSSADCGVYL